MISNGIYKNLADHDAPDKTKRMKPVFERFEAQDGEYLLQLAFRSNKRLIAKDMFPRRKNIPAISTTTSGNEYLPKRIQATPFV